MIAGYFSKRQLHLPKYRTMPYFFNYDKDNEKQVLLLLPRSQIQYIMWIPIIPHHTIFIRVRQTTKLWCIWSPHLSSAYTIFPDVAISKSGKWITAKNIINSLNSSKRRIGKALPALWEMCTGHMRCKKNIFSNSTKTQTEIYSNLSYSLP